MAFQFVVEDGTGLSTATSYISLAEMKQYWDNFGYDYSSLTDDQISVLLNKASAVLDAMYISRWPGLRASDEQRFEWPRVAGFYADGWPIDPGVVPNEVKNAVSELAYNSNSGTDIAPVQSVNGVVKSLRERVEGAVDQSITYVSGSGAGTGVPYMNNVVNALRRMFGNPTKVDIERV